MQSLQIKVLTEFVIRTYLHAVEEDPDGQNWVKQTQETGRRYGSGHDESCVGRHNTVWETQTCTQHTHTHTHTHGKTTGA